MQNQRQSDNNGMRSAARAQPLLGQRAPEIQSYGTVADYPLALDAQARVASVEVLNQLNDHQLKAGGFKSFRRTSPPTERENG